MPTADYAAAFTTDAAAHEVNALDGLGGPSRHAQSSVTCRSGQSHPKMSFAVDKSQASPLSTLKPHVLPPFERFGRHSNRTTSLALYRPATALSLSISRGLGARAEPPFSWTKMISNKSPDFRTSCSDLAVSFRMATISTMPHHSPPARPLKETNRQRLATRRLRARKRISVHLSVFRALSAANLHLVSSVLLTAAAMVCFVFIPSSCPRLRSFQLVSKLRLIY